MSDEVIDDGGLLRLPSGAVVESHLTTVDVDERWLTRPDREALARYMAKKWAQWAKGSDDV